LVLYEGTNAQAGFAPASRAQPMERMNNLIMMRTSKSMMVCTAVLCCLLVGLAFGVSNGEKAKVKGVIATRTGETLVLATDSGNVTVVLNDDTKVQQPKGLGLRKKQMSVTVLVPGLRVTADGVGDAQSRVVAKSITFDADDLQMAEAIQAGLTPTKQAVATNQENIAATKKLPKPINRPYKPIRQTSLRIKRPLRPISRRFQLINSKSRTPPSGSPNSASTIPKPTLASTSQSENQQSRRATKPLSRSWQKMPWVRLVTLST
jgi:hypothetical protein